MLLCESAELVQLQVSAPSRSHPPRASMFHQKWFSLLSLRPHKVATELLIKAIIAPRTSFLKYLSLWHQLVAKLWSFLSFWNICVSVDIADVVLGSGGGVGTGQRSCPSAGAGLGSFVTYSVLKCRYQNYTWCHPANTTCPSTLWQKNNRRQKMHCVKCQGHVIIHSF